MICAGGSKTHGLSCSHRFARNDQVPFVETKTVYIR
jgi:hypothetical protein